VGLLSSDFFIVIVINVKRKSYKLFFPIVTFLIIYPVPEEFPAPELFPGRGKNFFQNWKSLGKSNFQLFTNFLCARNKTNVQFSIHTRNVTHIFFFFKQLFKVFSRFFKKTSSFWGILFCFSLSTIKLWWLLGLGNIYVEHLVWSRRHLASWLRLHKSLRSFWLHNTT
jgi:hypothetical protein